MEKNFGRGGRAVSQLNLDRMALIGPDPKAVLAERKSFLVVARHDILKFFEREFKPAPARRFNQLPHRRPAGRVETETDLLGLMPQHQTEKFTDPDRAIIIIHAFSNKIWTRELRGFQRFPQRRILFHSRLRHCAQHGCDRRLDVFFVKLAAPDHGRLVRERADGFQLPLHGH